MSAPPMAERIERSLVGLIVLVVLLLVIMPGMLYLVGWGVTRYTRKAPARIGFPVPRDELRDRPIAEEPASGEG
jgi:hypothetical protein